ncbi:MAG: methyltransferase domain-containing protein, partial [Ilumatobacter sp.]|nr:methyltransferase domain-containing protein [Ilumatobacter sp.]
MRVTVLTVPSVDAELAADRLWSAGAQAVEEIDDETGSTELRTVLGDDAVATQRLGPLPARWRLGFVDADERPAETWREFAHPVDVSEHLTIRPAWLPSDERSGVLEIAIEPGGAFGLGDHPTTRLSAAAVDRYVEPGQAVLDVGCGSGVLAILASVRGAQRVVAIDVAEAARTATLSNAETNDVDLEEVSTRSVFEVEGQFDLVVANILAPALVAMADQLRRLTA